MRTPAWLSRISQPDALSWPAWLLLSVPALMWGAAYVGTRTSMPFGQALLWGAAAWGAMGLVWLIARLTWMRVTSPTLRAALILPTLAAAALARSVTMVTVGGGIREGFNPIPLGVLTFTILSVAALLLAGAFRELKHQNGRLAAIRDALAESDTRARMESESLRSSARQVVMAAVENALEAERSGERAAIRLRQVSDEVVRPLSHTLALTESEDEPAVTPTPRRDLVALGRAILASGPLRPLLTAGLAVTMSFNVIAVSYGGPFALVAGLVMAVTIAAVLTPFRFVPWARLSVARGIGGLVAAFVAAGLLSGGVFQVIPLARVQISNAPVVVAIVVLVCGTFVAVMRGLLRQQRDVEEDLVTEGRRLVVVGRATQARIRRDRRHLARVLHGVVQPRIVARSIRLQAAGEAIDVEELVDEIDGLLSQGSSSDSAIDLNRSLEDVVKVWSGSAALQFEIGADVESTLAGQDSTARAVVDIACEAVNNAVLRGGATGVSLHVFLEESTVSIVVTNAAGAVLAAKPTSATTGLGSRVFDDLADHWSLESRNGETVFTATMSLPIRRVPPGDRLELPAV
ncbi:MAG: hypothetical protein RL134_1112 [Actinomycetota bacterium]